MPTTTPPLVAVMGPTASGKSYVAESLADALGLQLVSADAFMVYRGLDIGTNKPTRKTDYELLDIVDPHEEFGVGEWVRRAVGVLEQLYESGQGAVVVGGTGFYVRALFEEYADLKPAPEPGLRTRIAERLAREGLAPLVEELVERSPEVAKTTDLRNPVRVTRALERLEDDRPPIEFKLPPFSRNKFVLEPSMETLDEAIESRLLAMLDAGWREEVAGLLGRGVTKDAPAFRAIGYDSVIELTEGEISQDEAVQRIALETRQYAKRQRTWLRSEPNARTIPVTAAGEQGLQSGLETIIECLNSPGFL